MIKISEAIKELINKNQIVKFGLSYRLFNLTQLSKFLIPQIEARTKKEITRSAALMNLSRIQRQMSKTAPKLQSIKLENIAIYQNLCTLTFFKSAKVREKINKLYKQVRKERSFMTITEGISEITIIIKEDFYKTAKKTIRETPKNERKNLDSIGIKFPAKYNENPGLLYLILQQTALQYINVIEITSTYTELFLYIDRKNTKLAFDTLLNSFGSI